MKKGSALAIMVSGIGISLLVAGPASAGGGGGGGSCSGFSEGDQLAMRDNCFDGAAHFSASGSTFVVENGGIIPHTYTAVDGSFDTGILQPGESSKIYLDRAGVVKVWCTLHGTAHGGGMAGVLLIGEPMPAGMAVRSPDTAEIGIRSVQAAIEPIDQMEAVSRIEETLVSLYATSRNKMLAVVATGGLLGALVISFARRSRRSDAQIEITERPGDQVKQSD